MDEWPLELNTIKWKKKRRTKTGHSHKQMASEMVMK